MQVRPVNAAMTGILSVLALVVSAHAAGAAAADAIAEPLTGRPGDPERGARLIAERQKSLCVLCHGGPFPDPHLHGTIAPDLTGVGSRLTEGQIRLRVADMRRVNPATIMPSYHRPADADPDRRVAAAWRGRAILDAADIEDLVAYLITLKE